MDTQPPQPKKLYRSSKDKIIFGVCGGLGEYFDISPIIVRALFVLFTLMGGGSVILYIILVFVIPSDNPAINSRQEFKDLADTLGAKAQEIASEFKSEKTQSGSSRHFFGLLIILVGAFFLLRELLPWPMYHYFPWFRWDIFWPSLIILVGLYIILKKTKV
jgi:phage shock protein PspC (stress-responsive transcriptional regulator)